MEIQETKQTHFKNISIKDVSLIKKLYSIGCFQRGSFRLKSGITSSLYFDMRKVISYPELFSKLIDRLYNFVKNKGSAVIGVPYAGIPYASGISLRYHIPQLLMRKERKKYGMKQLIEGEISETDKCILIEDVITTGTSVEESIVNLRKEGYFVSFVCSIIDREMGGKERLETMCPYVSIWTESFIQHVLTEYKDRSFSLPGDLLPMYHPERRVELQTSMGKRLIDIVQEKKTNLIFSADISNMNECLHVIDKVGPYVCVVKTHVDCIKDFNSEWGNRIHLLAKKHNFLILEDRKYCDIGNTTLIQYRNSYQEVHKWADIVTAYCTTGEGMIDALSRDNVQMLLIAELSSKGNTLTDKYLHQTLDIAQKYRKKRSWIYLPTQIFR